MISVLRNLPIVIPMPSSFIGEGQQRPAAVCLTAWKFAAQINHVKSCKKERHTFKRYLPRPLCINWPMIRLGKLTRLQFASGFLGWINKGSFWDASSPEGWICFHLQYEELPRIIVKAIFARLIVTFVLPITLAFPNRSRPESSQSIKVLE